MELELHIDGDVAVFRVSGHLGGDADFSPILTQPRDTLVLDLERVGRISSMGIREWILFVNSLAAPKRLYLDRCPISFVKQVNMIHNLLGPAEMRSLYLPYYCESCDDWSQRLDQVEDLRARGLPPAPRCETCGGALEFDALEDWFLGFLKPQRK